MFLRSRKRLGHLCRREQVIKVRRVQAVGVQRCNFFPCVVAINSSAVTHTLSSSGSVLCPKSFRPGRFSLQFDCVSPPVCCSTTQTLHSSVQSLHKWSLFNSDCNCASAGLSRHRVPEIHNMLVFFSWTPAWASWCSSVALLYWRVLTRSPGLPRPFFLFLLWRFKSVKATRHTVSGDFCTGTQKVDALSSRRVGRRLRSN